jgi:hypothetical protein
MRMVKSQRVGAGIVMALGLLVLGADYAFTSMWGLPVFVLGLFWLLCTIERCRRGRMQFTWTAIAAGLFAHGQVTVAGAPFFTLPVGTEIWAAGYLVVIMGISVLSFLVGVPMALAGCIVNRRYFLNGFAILLCSTVWWSGNAMFDAALRLRGLILSN